jgi:iron complex outermembrane recepter protein
VRGAASLRLALALATLSSLGHAHEVVAPRPVLQPDPEWPGEPATHDVVVPVILTVGADGAVEHVEITASLGRELDAAAVRAARRWVFEPARAAEGPVAARVRAVVRFVGRPASDAQLPVPVEVMGHGEEEHAAIDVTVSGEAAPRSPSQSVRERDLLQAAPRRTASDLLRSVPGVFVTQHSGEGKAHQIFFRGFDAVHGQDLEIVVGGIPVNEVSNVHGQGYADLHFLMPEIVERIVALPGAYDPSQGDFAVAGSIRFDLGYDEPGVTMKGSYGSFGTRRLFAVYRPDGAPRETFAAAELYATDGFGPARSASRASTIGQVVIPLDAGLSLRMLASAHASRFLSAGVLRQSDVEAGLVDRFASYDPEQGGDATRAQLGLELGYEREGWRASLMPFLVRRTLSLRFNFTGSRADPDNGDNTLQRNDSTTLGVTGRFEKVLHLLSDHDSVGGGVDARHDLVDQSHSPSRGDGAPLVDASLAATHVGGYLDAATRAIPRTVVRAGLRFDGLFFAVDDRLANEHRAADGMQVSPKATVDVALTPGLHALIAYGMGFRSPQARGLVDGDRSPFTRVHGFEAGLRYGDATLRGSFAGFATLLDDDLVFDETTSRNEPVQATMRLGAAADLTARVDDWFASAVGASFTRATFRDSGPRFAEGDLVPFVPQLVLRSDTSLTPRLGRFVARDLVGRVGLGSSFLFHRPLPHGEIGSDVFVVDALAGLRWGEIELGLEVTNLLDAAFYDGQFVYASTFGAVPSAVPQRHVTAGAPRMFMGTVALHL